MVLRLRTTVSFLFFFFLFVFLSSLLNRANAENYSTPDYLKLRLVHRNPGASPQQILAADFRRLAALRAPIVSGASTTGSGQYLVDLRVGSPPQRLMLVADTGSDLVWLRCSACRNCSNRAPGSAFLARHSRTFAPFHCYSPTCRRVPAPKKPLPCNHTRLHSTCRYHYTYADASSTSGFYSRDAVTLNASSGRVARLPRLDFGCGFRVQGPSLSGARGVLGLGRGPISFVSQMGKAFGNKFSYCLMDYTISPPPTSYLLIGGSHATKPLSFTPLLHNPLSPTFYYIGIQSVTVDRLPLKIDPSVWALDGSGNGGTVVDSGTTLTFLPDPAYRQILSAFKRRVRLPRVTSPAPGLGFCVNVSGADEPTLPRLGFHLLGGAAFWPPASNYFVDAADGVKCLALQAVDSPAGFAVIGNLMQQGFLLEFDRDKSRLGFSRTGCGLS